MTVLQACFSGVNARNPISLIKIITHTDSQSRIDSCFCFCTALIDQFCFFALVLLQLQAGIVRCTSTDSSVGKPMIIVKQVQIKHGFTGPSSRSREPLMRQRTQMANRTFEGPSLFHHPSKESFRGAFSSSLCDLAGSRLNNNILQKAFHSPKLTSHNELMKSKMQ